MNNENKGPTLKIGHDHKLAKYIEKKIIQDKYSPDAVIGEIKAKGIKFESSICTKTLYNYIDKGIFANISNKDLPVKKNKKKGTYRKVKIAHKNLKGTSIEENYKKGIYHKLFSNSKRQGNTLLKFSFFIFLINGSKTINFVAAICNHVKFPSASLAMFMVCESLCKYLV